MKVLVTGARGFVGKNLCAQLGNIKTGKAKYYSNLVIDEVYEYDIDSTPEQLDAWCKNCDFVFNLAGVNRPQDPKEFMEGNFGFATILLNTLKKHKNNCPVMISSSIQATLAGRFGTSEYGKSKKAGEELMFQYGEETGAKVLVYRFPMESGADLTTTALLLLSVTTSPTTSPSPSTTRPLIWSSSTSTTLSMR